MLAAATKAGRGHTPGGNGSVQGADHTAQGPFLAAVVPAVWSREGLLGLFRLCAIARSYSEEFDVLRCT